MLGTDVQVFIDRWDKSGGAERANYALFLSELAELIGAARPDPAQPDEAANAYVLDKTVTFKHADGTTSTGYIDLYKRGCFVCEAKQSVKPGKQPAKDDPARIALHGQEDAGRTRTGTAKQGTAGWDLAMERARRQAEGYAKALPKEHGWPPFLVIADVGHCIELFADFSGQGKNYAQFPDRRSFRIMLADLAREDVRARLKLVWTDPNSLDPARRSAEVTRDIAARLAVVAKELETKHDPQAVALFLMRCLFTMFAEDVELITPAHGFLAMLRRFKGRAHQLHGMLAELWQRMDSGGFSAALEGDVRRFNGGLFRDATAMPINEEMLGALILAAERDWRDVEPAIFGTLLERALAPKERAALGAHYTPRAYVERLVIPTIMEPLQEDWAAARVEAQQALEAKDVEKARAVVQRFHMQLCNTRVLDPACGTGNFLYVAMELMKRLEGEVLEFAASLGATGLLELDRVTVDPHNFLGLELNPRAKEIAELVIWIGFIKWQIRTGGQDVIRDPVLRDFKTIQCKDAVLAWDKQELLLDEAGKPVTKWDGQTTKLHPVTGEQVPDEAARIELYRYQNPRIQDWPEAEFIVGNPPFLGGQALREELGDGYAEALWASRAKRKWVPNSADFVMYWWDQAAHALTAASSKVRRFGFVTTNSITQTFSRRVIQHYLEADRPLSLAFAIPDHPWVKGEARAQVRIAMTVARSGGGFGCLKEVTREEALNTDTPLVELRTALGRVNADLSVGAEFASANPLRANKGVSTRGVQLMGSGFILDIDGARKLLAADGTAIQRHIRPFVNGRDLTQVSRNSFVLDFFGLSEEEVRSTFPSAYQEILERVKPEREANNRPSYRERWWIFGEPHPSLRLSLEALPRFIVSCRTAKHRVFSFVAGDTLPESKVIAIASDRPEMLALVSSKAHVSWALRTGGWLGVGNDPTYNHTECFNTFPFPDLPPAARDTLATLGEELDAFRKARQADHPGLTITDMYNVLEKLRRGDALTDDDKRIHEHGLISTLKRIHDQIDETVAAAYGLPVNAADEAILEHFVALNRTRAEEEKRGLVRWLRPEFQNPTGKAAAPTVAPDLGLEIDDAAERPAFPDSTGDRARAVRAALITYAKPATPEEIARTFRQGARVKKSVADLLETMTALGQAEEREGRYFAA